jgi:Flp pilus assembly protein TadG
MIRRIAARFWRDRTGVAATEAALATSIVLIPLSLGIIDYGALVADEARLDRALQSAVYYVWNNPTGFTTAGIQSAAAAGFGTASPTVTVTASSSCQCVSNGYSPVGGTVSCSATCPSGEALASYLTITATATFTLPVTVPTLASSLTRSVSGAIRTQ